MQKIITYKGSLKGVNGFWCGKKPKGLKDIKEIEVYYPDKGKAFLKDGVIYKTVILKKNEKIEDYKEVEI